MDPHPHVIANAGVVGFLVSFMTTIVSFCASALPVMQFFAALAALTAGTVSALWTLKQRREAKKAKQDP